MLVVCSVCNPGGKMRRFGAGAHEYGVDVVDVVIDEHGIERHEKMGLFLANNRTIQVRRQRNPDVMLEVLSHEISHMWDVHYVLDLDDGEQRANARQTPIAQLLLDFHKAGGLDWLRAESRKLQPALVAAEHGRSVVPDDDGAVRYEFDDDVVQTDDGSRKRTDRRCECPQCQRVINGNRLRISEPYYDYDAPGHFTRCEFDCVRCKITVKFVAPFPFDPEEPIDMERDKFEVVAMGAAREMAEV